MKARRYEDLIVWQKAHTLVKSIYQISNQFPSEEKYSLTSQLCRSAISITGNIAEGFGRYHAKEKIQFYNISIASLNETDNYLKLVHELEYTDTISIQKECAIVRKMLSAYIKSIKTTPNF